MRGLTVLPRAADTLRLEHLSEPPLQDGDALVATAAIGLCGTDHEIVAGEYGAPPRGSQRLVLGHESIGRVIEAPAGKGLSAGDWVVGIVRHPDPEPCACCAAGEWDMCRNGRYTEHGILERHGFASDVYRIESERLVKVDPALGELGVLIEPASVVAKAWEHIGRIGARACWQPRSLLVTGAGPIGLLGALFGAQRGLEVHVFDRVREGLKPELVRELGATYHSESVEAAGNDWDVVLECTGAADIFFRAIRVAGPNGIICLTGVSSGGRVVNIDPAALNREMVLENNVVFGTVNANRRHYEQAAAALARAERAWLDKLISRRLPIERFREGFARQPDDVKVLLTF